MRKFAFIDYENVGSIKNIALQDYEKIYLFVGAKQNFDPETLNEKLLEKTHFIKIKETAKNNLDFHLIWYASQVDSETSKKIYFEIISDDKGFDPLLIHVKKTGRQCGRLGVKNKISLHDMIVNMLLSTKNECRPQKEKSLLNHITAFFKQRNVNDINAVKKELEKLKKENLIRIENTKVIYCY
jgi:hypothetical protein